ncbi:DUF6557 family protein [Christiangramia sp.]|uniref:DUF6557 family protein n=1 Tax=Christiangramia sp. TaxID=1931228 RepID=UPI0026178733|nr:DUF6557 family protein [Christiangramia sp.]
MTLKQMLQSNSWLSIASVFRELYPEEGRNMEGYENVFDQLVTMSSEETDMEILIKTVKDDFDSSEYVDVSGKYLYPKSEEEEFARALEFTAWSKWLAMNISPQSLKSFSELEILAHCLHEMTFAGFEEVDIQQQLDSINKTVEEYKVMSEEEKQENITSIDELLLKLKEDDEENNA